MKGRHAQSHDNASEHAHLQRCDTDYGCGSSFQHSFCSAVVHDHGPDGRMHDKKCDGRGQRRHLFFLFRHTDSDAHGKNNGQIGKYDVTGLTHNLQNGIKHRSRSHDPHQSVSSKHGLIGKRAAHAQQQACHRQDCDWKHKGSSHSLKYTENLVFHENNPSYLKFRFFPNTAPDLEEFPAVSHVLKSFRALSGPPLFCGCFVHVSAPYYLHGALILRIEKGINMHKHPLV